MKLRWPTVRLGEVLRRSEETVDLEPTTLYREITVKLWGKGVVLRGVNTGSQVSGSRRFVARKDQFILSRIDARNGAIGIVPEELDGAIVSNDFPLFVPDNDRIDLKFLGWLSRTQGFVELCLRASEGTTNRVRLQESRFLSLQIPLPPLPQQRRIVAYIDELDTHITEARLLRQITSEETRALSYASLRQARQQLLCSRHPKARLGSFTKVTSGGTPSREIPTYWNGTIPWVKTGELLDGDIAETDEHITESAVKNSSAKLFQPETVLIALYGQGQTRGRTGRLLVAATTNQACCAIFPKPELFQARYLQYWLRSLYVELREEAQGGAQPNWNGAMIKDLEIILPPIQEQRRIVAELDALQAEVDALKRLQDESAAELNTLLPSILDRAFKGEHL